MWIETTQGALINTDTIRRINLTGNTMSNVWRVVAHHGKSDMTIYFTGSKVSCNAHLDMLSAFLKAERKNKLMPFVMKPNFIPEELDDI